MNEIDELKTLGIQGEIRFMDHGLIELISDLVICDLVDWTNKAVFFPADGKISVATPAVGSPNARAITPLDTPLHPTIEIRLSMLIEIYRDAFTFPLISRRIADETDSIQLLNESDERFRGKSFIFSSGIPSIDHRLICTSLQPHALAMATLVEEKNDHRMGKNEVYFRFLMFELMLVWTYFHELSHILQQHYLLNSSKIAAMTGFAEIDEMNDDAKDAPAIEAQAREILADAEGIDLTLQYLGRSDRISHVTMYVLLCSMGCMFQRFYNQYSENLDVPDGKHPHPAIRDDLSHDFCIRWTVNHLTFGGDAAELYQVALPLIYCSTRSSLVTGLFRSHRVERRNDTQLPSYMKLSSEEHLANRKAYLSVLRASIDQQSTFILKNHLRSDESFASVLSCLYPALQ